MNRLTRLLAVTIVSLVVAGALSSSRAQEEKPVEQVTWESAVEFCAKLSAVPEEQAARRSYRLPTEAEWEYAARAGRGTPFASGLGLGTKYGHFNRAVEKTVKVGSYRPNA